VDCNEGRHLVTGGDILATAPHDRGRAMEANADLPSVFVEADFLRGVLDGQTSASTSAC
jgi:hypothetical protein